MPKISVILPAYNAEKYIKEALDSILSQTFADFELIVLNDCSQDSTEEIILSYEDPRIVYVKNEENLGVARTLNKGLALAKGEYIARMDADDISLPQRFQKQVEYLDAHGEYGICGCWLQVFSDEGDGAVVQYAQEDREIRADQLFNSGFAHPGVMLRSHALWQAGEGYDPLYEKAEDYELWHRMLSVSKGHNLPLPLLRYRHHGAQVTVTCKKQQAQAVVRLHEKMLREINAELTSGEMQVFLALCAGIRTFSEEEYEMFISGGKKLVAAAKGYSGAVRKVYSGLNMAVIRASDVEKGHCFSWREPAYRVYRRLRGKA